MKKRHLARQTALQVLTALLLNPTQTASEAIAHAAKELAPQLNNLDFLNQLVEGVLAHRETLDAQITELAPQFPIAKLDPVDRSILELGGFEILHYDTPTPVAINEAVDLAKEFGDDAAGRFVNGVLSNLAKQHQGKASKEKE